MNHSLVERPPSDAPPPTLNSKVAPPLADTTQCPLSLNPPCQLCTMLVLMMISLRYILFDGVIIFTWFNFFICVLLLFLACNICVLCILKSFKSTCYLWNHILSKKFMVIAMNFRFFSIRWMTFEHVVGLSIF